jgi:hypothetical protein
MENASPIEHGRCVGSPEMLTITGLTYRKLDHWTHTGRLNGHRHHEKSGSGVPTFWSADEAEVAARIARLMRWGFDLDTAALMARNPERIAATAQMLTELAPLPTA